jgi:prevent-host-death family protein
MDEKIPAGKFKAHCLKVMEKVRKTRRRITITKRNVPIAQLTPIDEKEEKAFGKLKGSVHFHGDIIKPIEEVWHADN